MVSSSVFRLQIPVVFVPAESFLQRLAQRGLRVAKFAFGFLPGVRTREPGHADNLGRERRLLTRNQRKGKSMLN